MGVQQVIKHISQEYVRPEIEVDDSKRQYNLNCSDLSMLLLGYSQCIHVFNKPQNFNSSIFLDKFIHSLSKVLVHFYPFAGQFVTESYKDGDENSNNSCSIYIDCHKGLGAKVILAEADDIIIDNVLSHNSDVPDIVQSLFETGVNKLINYDGHTKPLLSVQVTELRDGVAIGICTNHSVADGTTVVNLFNIWSDMVMEMESSMIDIPVSVKGTVIKLPYDDPTKLAVQLENNYTRERIFHFSPTSLALLKAKANADAEAEAEAVYVVSGNNNTNNSNRISSFQALAAFMWRCITRARSLCPSARTTCGLIANGRARHDPPLSQDYFGNFLEHAREIVEVGELLANSLGWTALLLHRAVKNLNDTCVETETDESVPHLHLFGLQTYGPNPVVFGGSPRLDVYGAEFGLGRPLAVHMGFRETNGFVSTFPGAKGDGSVDIQVCLAPEAMSLLISDEELMSFVSNPIS